MNISKEPTEKVFQSARQMNIIGEYSFVLRRRAELEQYCKNMIAAIKTELAQGKSVWLVSHILDQGRIFNLDWCIIRAFCESADPDNEDVQVELPEKPGYYLVDERIKLDLQPFVNPSKREGAPVFNAPIPKRSSPTTEKSKQEKTKLEERIQQLQSELGQLQQQVEQERLQKNALDRQIQQLQSEQQHLESSVQQLKEQETHTQANIQRQLEDAEAQVAEKFRLAELKTKDMHAALVDGICVEKAQEGLSVQTNDAAPLREKVEDDTHRMETSIRNSFEAYRNELDAYRSQIDIYRDEIHQMLYDFRTGLYKTDYSSLCFAYQKLYMFTVSIFTNRINNLFQDVENKELATQLQIELHKLQGQLLRRVTAIEENLKKYGLIVYRPEVGEEYNEVYHVAENAEDDGYLEASITSCVCPGIRTENVVLCRASVMVHTVTQS